MPRRKRNKKRYAKAQKAQKKSFCPSVIFCLMVIGSIALAYLCIQEQNTRLGERIKAVEESIVKTDRKILEEEHKWTLMTDAVHLRKLLHTHGIHMDLPRRGGTQVVKIYDMDVYLSDEHGVAEDQFVERTEFGAMYP